MRPIVLLFLVTLLPLAVVSQNGGDSGMSLSGLTIVATPGATGDGSVIMGHNEYAGKDVFPDVYKVGGKDNNIKKIDLPVDVEGIAPAQSGFLWIQVSGRKYSDTYLNEYGVAITSQITPARSQIVSGQTGKTGFWLPYLSARKSMTAREAVSSMGEIVERAGFSGEGITCLISDLYESWVMCILPGNNWLAQRVPDGAVAVITGYYPVNEVDFENESFMYSPGIKEFAIQMGLYHPDVNEKFNFRKIFSSPASAGSQKNKRTVIQVFNELSGFNFREDDDLPFFITTSRKLDINYFKNIMRFHGINSGIKDIHNPSNFPICTLETTYSAVIQLRNWMPRELASILWYAPLRPCLQVFTPFYSVIQRVPSPFYRGNSLKALLEHDSIKGFAAGKKTPLFSIHLQNEEITANPESGIRKLKTMILQKEKKYIEEIEKKEKKVMDLYKRGLVTGSIVKDISEFNLKLIKEPFVKL